MSITNEQLRDELKDHMDSRCEPCRRVVMGNGRKPLDSRVSILEWATLGVGGLITFTSVAVIGAVVAWALGYLT